MEYLIRWILNSVYELFFSAAKYFHLTCLSNESFHLPSSVIEFLHQACLSDTSTSTEDFFHLTCSLDELCLNSSAT